MGCRCLADRPFPAQGKYVMLWSMELTAAEQRLIDHVVAGELLNLDPADNDGAVVDLQRMDGWGPEHNIRAEVIRRILRELPPPGAGYDPRGLRLRGARIIGRLELASLRTSLALELESCLVTAGINARDCTIPKLWLRRSVIGVQSASRHAEALCLSEARITGSLWLSGADLSAEQGCALVADGIVVEGDLLLNEGFRAVAKDASGTLVLNRGSIGGHLNLQDAQLANAAGPALEADHLVLGGSMFLDEEFTASGTGDAGTIRLPGVRIRGDLGMSDAHLDNDAGPALIADQINVEGSMLLEGGFKASGRDGIGTLRLPGARVGGQLSLNDAHLENADGPALNADALTVDGSLFLNGTFTATGRGNSGTIRLVGARIGSQLSLSDAALENKDGPALNADGITVESSLFLDGTFTAIGRGESGTICLVGARIGGQLSLSDASLENADGPALNADGITVESSLFLDGSFTATGRGEIGTICLVGTRVGGLVSLSNAHLVNAEGPALSADRIIVHGDLYLDQGFVASGTGEAGTVRLLGARVMGQFSMSGAQLANGSGPALNADVITVEGDLHLSDDFHATGHGDMGTIRLSWARINGQFSLRTAQLENAAGPALQADRAIVGNDVFLDEGFNATGTGQAGAVRLPGARIAGQLSLNGARLQNPDGASLLADGVAVESDMYLDDGFRAVGLVSLRDAAIAGRLFVSIQAVQAAVSLEDPECSWDLDGATYRGYPTQDVRQWLDLVVHGTWSYAAQPFQQLAKNAREAGHDRDVRRILIRQRRDQLHRAAPGSGERLWGALTRVTVGYGYRPWLALLWVGAVFCIALGMVFWWAADGLVTTPQMQQSGLGLACTNTQRILIAIDLSFPLVSTGADIACQIDARSTAGEHLLRVGAVLKALSWGFTALFVAGFTGIVRRS